MKNGLAIGIIFLFLFSALAPMSIGFNVKISNEKIQTITSQNIESTEHIWPMEKNNAQGTGRTLYDTSQNKGGEKWKYFIDSGLWGSVAIDKDGILYAGSPFDGLHVVYPNGTLKWKQDYEGHEYQTPAIAPDGTFYVGTTDYVYAYYPNGTIKWIFYKEGNFFSEPVVDSNGTVYFGTQEGIVYAIFSNGSLKWEFNAFDYIFNIQLDKDGNIYFGGSYSYCLYCLNPNGTIRWRYQKQELGFIGGVAIGDDGTIYAVPTYYLVALYPNGTEKWAVDFTENDFYGYPSITPDGTIILSGEGEYITALDPSDGSVIWQYYIGLWSLVDSVSQASIGGDGTIYFAYTAYSDSEAFLVALNPDGSLKWETHLTTDIQPYDYVYIISNPSINSDGTVYITSWFGTPFQAYYYIGYIHAIGIDNPILLDSPVIVGSSEVKLFKEYEYVLKNNISTKSEVYYFIDWGDVGEGIAYNNFWIGPYPSNENVSIKHIWNISGKHTVKVKIKTNDSLCSLWGYFDVKVGLSRFRESEKSNILFNLAEQFPIIDKLIHLIRI